MGMPPTIQVASLGMADSLILMVLALVVFGPRRLPQIGRQIGKLMYEFRKASNDFKFQMEEELRTAEEADRRKQEERQRAQAALAAPAATGTTAETQPPADAAKSPYLEETPYAAVSEPAVEPPAEAAPRIQPPSTGEQVQAMRPSEQSGPNEAASSTGAAAALDAIEQAAEMRAAEMRAAEASASQANVAADEPATQQNAPSTESVSHNG